MTAMLYGSIYHTVLRAQLIYQRVHDEILIRFISLKHEDSMEPTEFLSYG